MANAPCIDGQLHNEEHEEKPRLHNKNNANLATIMKQRKALASSSSQ